MKKVIPIILGILFFVSCKNEKQENIDVKSIKIEGVQLNNNALWKANIETTKGIQKMLKTVSNFSSDASLTDYKLLKTNLESDFSEIFQKCNMKGEAHNQLHNYLKPMLPMLDAFESENKEIRSQNYKQLKKHLLGYTNYFE